MSKVSVYLLLNVLVGLAAGAGVYSLVGADLTVKGDVVLVMALIGFETFTVGGALILAGVSFLEKRRQRVAPIRD